MESHSILSIALYRLFRPVARIGLRHGVTVRDAIELLKCAYVDVAREEYGLRSRPTSKSRIATLTDLTRTEVTRFVDRQRGQFQQHGTSHPLYRLVERWLSDSDWQDHEGNPAVLDIHGKRGFTALAHAHGGDIPWQTLLRELERLRIAQSDDNHVNLLKHGFVPASDDETSGLPFIGEDVAALLDTVDYNLRTGNKQRRFQRKVSFFGLSEAGLEALQNRAAAEGQRFLKSLDEELAPHANTSDDDANRLTGLGIYVFDLQQPEGERP